MLTLPVRTGLGQGAELSVLIKDFNLRPETLQLVQERSGNTLQSHRKYFLAINKRIDNQNIHGIQKNKPPPKSMKQ
jgi:hypothetical protein